MKLNPNSNLASFYRYFYLKTDMPNNLCAYFWLVILAGIVSIFTWPAQLINYSLGKISIEQSTRWNYEKQEDEEFCYFSKNGECTPTMTGIVLSFILMILGAAVYTGLIKLFHLEFYERFFSCSMVTGIAMLIVLGFIGVILVIALFKGICYLWDKYGPKGPQTEEEWEAYYEKRRLENIEDQKRRAKRKANPSIFKLAWLRLVSFKEKNCPILNWSDVKIEK